MDESDFHYKRAASEIDHKLIYAVFKDLRIHNLGVGINWLSGFLVLLL